MLEQQNLLWQRHNSFPTVLCWSIARLKDPISSLDKILRKEMTETLL
jgi:hypothetical protein